MTNNLILIAEDDADIRDLLILAVEKAGFPTIDATNGGDAARLMLEYRPAGLITDVRMPQMDGIELCRLARQRPELENIALIMISASYHALDISEGLSAGADDYLPKPFLPRQLARRLQVLMDARQ